MTYILVGIAVTALLMLLNGVLVACETSVLMLTPGRAHRLIESGAAGARNLDTLIDIRHRLRAGTFLVSAATNAAGTFVCFAIALSVGWNPTLAVAAGLTMLVLGVIFLLTQAVPRAFAVTNPEYIALGLSGFCLAVTRAIGPLGSALSLPAKVIISAAGGERNVTIWAVTPERNGDSGDEDDAQREEAEEAILEAVSDFGDMIVREVMTPRTDMESLEDSSSIEEAAQLIIETGLSRIPIYHETTDDIRGILYSKDLLKALIHKQSSSGPRTLLDIARPALFVPETKPVRELLVEMRTRTHVAIVADEYGGTAGMVTLEDLLEEIVGDIADEFDRETPMIVELGDHSYIVDARVPVDELNDLYDTVLDVDADSVGGLFIELAGHIPTVGESIVVEGVELTTTMVEGNRVVQLRTRPVAPGYASAKQ